MKRILLLIISLALFLPTDAFSVFYRYNQEKTGFNIDFSIEERIPYEGKERTTIHGEKFTPMYISATITYQNGVPIACLYTKDNESYFTKLLDSTTKVFDYSSKTCYVSATSLTDKYYILHSIHQSDITIKILDILTGKIVIEQKCKVNCNNELLDSYNKNGYPKDYKISDVVGKPIKIDISKLPKNTSYIACWFNDKNEFFYSDIIRFGYWNYNAINNK